MECPFPLWVTACRLCGGVPLECCAGRDAWLSVVREKLDERFERVVLPKRVPGEPMTGVSGD